MGHLRRDAHSHQQRSKQFRGHRATICPKRLGRGSNTCESRPYQLSKRLWRGVAPRGGDGLANRCHVCAWQMHVGVTATAPCSFDRLKNIRLITDETFLIFRSEFDDGPIFIRIAERGEDSSADPKIGVIHVRRLNRFRKTESDLPKMVGSHERNLGSGRSRSRQYATVTDRR